ncbi:hypothetical protein CP061683_0752A, partial [Chlamydia psittaci 06-1683]
MNDSSISLIRRFALFNPKI